VTDASLTDALTTIDVTGRDVHTTKRFRDVARSGTAAVVIDGSRLARGGDRGAIEIAGHAEAVAGPSSLIRIHLDRVRSWGSSRQFDRC